MSLTSMLKGLKKNEKQFQSIIKKVTPNRNDFQTLSGNVAFSNEYAMLVPNALENPYNSMILGTAFDYMARLMIARVVTNNREDFFTELAAEKGLDEFKRLNGEDDNISIRLENLYNQAVNLMRDFVEGGSDIQTIVRVSNFSANLEWVHRNHELPADIRKSLFSHPSEDIARELEVMCKVFEEKFLIPEIVHKDSAVVYNPEFGLASLMVDGADGDIIIDGVLYDFKTGKPLVYSWVNAAQLIGYYFLNEISLTAREWGYESSSFNIEKVALYKARYGEIEYFDLKNTDAEKNAEITKELILHFEENCFTIRSWNLFVPTFLQEYKSIVESIKD
ncbi:hypothetical protein [Bacillus wiedmannii]|uniref:hypothetical protein n=1 Tax=Bacillus wiedmannii TaxID=1890302 RepID=UPI000D040E82|nr:hypothetical protein [Bacillus wiedmannii]PRT26780.1 hypothetical protein C6358_29505 [Bacillus wiedmannii]PRT37985.1 hypothetical protein C6359_29535 [Bacillus wiedmannii]